VSRHGRTGTGWAAETRSECSEADLFRSGTRRRPWRVSWSGCDGSSGSRDPSLSPNWWRRTSPSMTLSLVTIFCWRARSHDVCSRRGFRRALPYIARDGTPRVLATWFHWTGEVLAMPTFLAAPHVRHAPRRLAALRVNPDVISALDELVRRPVSSMLPSPVVDEATRWGRRAVSATAAGTSPTSTRSHSGGSSRVTRRPAASSSAAGRTSSLRATGRTHGTTSRRSPAR
jgi:hypothetical protein